MIYRITKKDKLLKGSIHLTASKSISNRVLIIRALCDEPFEIQNLASANDTILLEKLLNTFPGILNAEDAGTAFRFLTAYLSQKPGQWFLTGTDRMKERPIGILADALRKIGAEISYDEKENFPPLKISGKKLNGGSVEMDGSTSSQFISALLLIAPTLGNGLTIKLTGEISSRPYIDMTLKLMNEFGVIHTWNENVLSVKQQKYVSKNILIESDWSAASYWYEMAALSDNVDLTLTGLDKNSSQGDAVIAEMMKQFGVVTSFSNDGIRLSKTSVILPQKFSYDFQSCRDLVQTMAVTCVALGVKAEFRGVKNLRIKETDRLLAMQSEFRKVGSTSIISDFGFEILDSQLRTPDSKLQTYIDHRMAMSFAPLAIKLGEVEIENPVVVKKSYPEFWNDLKSVGFEIEKI